MRHIAHGGVVTLCGAQTEGNDGKNSVIEWQLLASADYAPLVTCNKCKGIFTAQHFNLNRFINMSPAEQAAIKDSQAEKEGLAKAKEKAIEANWKPSEIPSDSEFGHTYQQPAKQEVKAFTALDEINKHGESIAFLYEQLKFYREKIDNLLERAKIQEELLRATNDALGRLATKAEALSIRTEDYYHAVYSADGLINGLEAVEGFLENTFTGFKS